ncbi:MAG TPA: HlyD family type I secretion periplasmic adaptor subunit [Caulobacteraceae bacterium]|jgi:hemolysin D|nr:HlyD family type I secretion periplasmic adaptor subunit [Caulobacteraceae bacterium]
MSLDGISNAFTGLLRRGVTRFDQKDEREFLPAALEVLETPPSPAGRFLAIAIGLFFSIAAGWAFLGKVDIQATAPGRLLPSGKIKVIQPLDPGIVRSIQARDGDRVRAGQLLLELDPTQAGADRDKLARDLAQTRLDVARLDALKRMAETGGAPGPFVVPAGSDPDDVAQARAAMRAQIDQQAAKIATLQQQIGEKVAEQDEVTATIAKLNSSVPMLSQKERLHRQLHDEGYGTSFSFLDAQQQLSEARRDVVVEGARGDQARAAAAALAKQKAEAVSEFNAGVLADLFKAQEKENELSQDLVKAQQKSTQTQIRSPIDGVVEELAVHTVGGVVTPAERLMIVVPENQKLTVEAQLANRDVGFVHPGQDVQVKVETYSFTRYGLIHGKVIDVSRDAVAAAERQADESNTQPNAAPPAPGSPTYVARISLDRSTMWVDGQVRPLMPGMAVTAEVRTGRRTIIDYLLSPLARKGNEALHER